MKAETAGRIFGAFLLAAFIISVVTMLIAMVWGSPFVVNCAFTAMLVIVGLFGLVAIADKALNDKK